MKRPFKRHRCRNCGKHSLELQATRRHRAAVQFIAHRYYVCQNCKSRFVTVEGIYRIRPAFISRKEQNDPENPRLALKIRRG